MQRTSRTAALRTGLTLLTLMLVGGMGVLGQPARAQELPSPVARPDLTLTLQDLPPSYAEAPPMGLTFYGTPVGDRALHRTRPGDEPEWLWGATFLPGIPLTPQQVREMGQELARSLTGRFLVAMRESVGDEIELTDWAERAPSDIGEHATLYHFRAQRVDQPGSHDGALIAFSRGEVLSVLATLSTDEQATSHLEHYARRVDARIARAVAPTPGTP